MTTTGEKMKWSVENTCKLIELYREARLLWDARHPDYKNRYKKADALKEIGILCNTSSDEIDRKIKNINTQYQREHRNYQLLKKSGAGKTFVSKWFGYTLLGFLKDKNKPRPSGSVGGLSNLQVGLFIYVLFSSVSTYGKKKLPNKI